MRHGRKSRSIRINGYKRHVLHDLDSDLVRAVGITAANVAEASVTEAISEDLVAQQIHLQELHIDRAYLSSEWVRHRCQELKIYCKAWPVRQGNFFSKQEFHLDWERQIIRCPAEQEMPFTPGDIVHFPVAQLFIICISYIVLMLSFRLLDYLTDALVIYTQGGRSRSFILTFTRAMQVSPPFSTPLPPLHDLEAYCCDYFYFAEKLCILFLGSILLLKHLRSIMLCSARLCLKSFFNLDH